MKASPEENSGFIPSAERLWFIQLWRFYVRWLFRRRFRHIFIDVSIADDRSVVFYSNHFYWWDALIPFLLSHEVFRRPPRAIMEDRQMRRFPFFAWIGAFSVNRTERRGILETLRFAADSLKNPKMLLFVFPNGQFTDPGAIIPEFEPGLHWIAANASGSAVIPLAFFIDHRSGDKPDLWIKTGVPLEPASSARKEWLDSARNALQKTLDETRFASEVGWKKLF